MEFRNCIYKHHPKYKNRCTNAKVEYKFGEYTCLHCRPSCKKIEKFHEKRKCEHETKRCSKCSLDEISCNLGSCFEFISAKQRDKNIEKIDNVDHHIKIRENVDYEFHYLDDCDECKHKIKELVDDNINILEQYLSADDEDEDRVQEKDNFYMIYDVLNRKRMSCIKSARTCVD